MLNLHDLPVQDVPRLDVASLPRGAVSLLRVPLLEDPLGDAVRVPVMVARGRQDGPVVGVTGAVHGNELNGVRVIHQLFRDIGGRELRGAVVGVPIVNVHGFVRHQRDCDGTDINRAMPGRENGPTPEVFAVHLLDRIVSSFNYLLDLHTASFGRVNSVYVRADLTQPETAWMARAQHPHIIVHHKGADGTLRSAAMARGIHAITIEIGDPQLFQRELVERGRMGVENVLARLGAVDLDERVPDVEPAVCTHSYWLYTDAGGLLEVYPERARRVRKGEIIARLTDAFGRVTREYRAPEDGIVVGKSTNPVAHSGARILHLGVEGEPEGNGRKGDIE